MTEIFRKFTCFITSFSFFFFVTACAKIGTPTGGPKDITPPKVEKSIPEMNSINFKGKRVDITFDEFVQLNDINKAFVTSPPMKKKPIIYIRNKSVLINLEEELKDSTTYRFYFGDAIVDLNEKNPLKNFEFVFSTGQNIDSLSLRGRVIDAFDHKPDKESFYVMLYTRFEDSIPRKQLPEYITKTNEKGWFSITHVKQGNYMIFALKDLNQNYLFDMPNEPLAFSDTLLHLDQHYFLPDSLVKADTTSADTANRAPFKSQIQLYSFVENHEKQFLKKNERTTPEKINFIFNTPIPDSLKIVPLNFVREKWLMPDYPYIKRDTASFWVTDTSLAVKDTIRVKLTYLTTDSLNKLVPRTDTITLAFKRPVAAGRNRKQIAPLKVSSFKMNSNMEGQSTLGLNQRFSFQPSHPLGIIDTGKISLVKIIDKKRTKVRFRISKDAGSSRLYFVNFKMEPSTDYELIADSMAFSSIYHQVSDSLGFKFQTQKDDYYGKIRLKLNNVKGRVIIQLLSAKDEVIRQLLVNKDQELVFDLLDPSKYKFRAIYDKNGNGIWDSGNFAQKLQPEKVLYFSKEIPLRSNWEDSEVWDLE